MRSPAVPVAAPGNATILIYLSLFLLLLVFFIVLNAHSTPRDYRVRAVLDSVEHRFAPSPDSPGGSESHLLAAGTPAAIAVAGLKRLGDLFEADLALVKVETVSRGRLMVVTMPADELFIPGGAEVRRERIGLIDRIARELADRGSDQGGVRFEGDFLIGMGGEPAGVTPSGDPVAQAAALARVLIGDGAPADAISVGIEPGRGGSLRFLFAPRLTGGLRPGKAGLSHVAP